MLVPSRDGGTGALLRAPHDAIPSAFGKESAAAHRAAARSTALSFAELRLPSLSVDVDRLEDAAVLAEGAGGRRTRAALREAGAL